MLTDDIALISVDDHVVEPPHVWMDRLPQRYRDTGPHIEEAEGKTQAWVYQGKRYPMSLQGSPATRRFRTDGTGDDFQARHYDDMVEGAYDPKARVEAMDVDGVTAQLLFPTFPRFCGQTFLEGDDRDLSLLCVQAYNDWMIEEWCATAPERFIPMVMLPLWDPGLAAVEIERAAGKGAKAITFTENPAPLGLPSFWSDYWDPVFAAAAATELPLCMHIGSSSKLVIPAPESSDAVPISLCGLNAMSACADLIFSGILHRNPGVKIALSEGGSGWVPYLVERMDYTWERTRIDVDRSVAPSELFRRHFWTCFISDDTAIAMRHLIGIDKLMWEGDYPHNDSNWPNSRTRLAESFVDVPEDEVRRITELNARELFRFS